jgi:hypothetical protein
LYFPRNYPFTYPNHLPPHATFLPLFAYAKLPIFFVYHPLFYPSAHPPLPKYQIPACKRYIYTIRCTLHVLFYLWLPCLFHSCSPIAISLSLGPIKYIRLALCSFEARIWALDLARAQSFLVLLLIMGAKESKPSKPSKWKRAFPARTGTGPSQTPSPSLDGSNAQTLWASNNVMDPTETSHLPDVSPSIASSSVLSSTTIFPPH